MSKEKRLYLHSLLTACKRSNASNESIEAIYDFVYDLEKIDRSYEEMLLLVDAYCFLGLHHKASTVFLSVNTTSFSAKELKKYQKKVHELQQNSTHNTRFYYRDLRIARSPKTPQTFSQETFIISNEDARFQISFTETIQSVVIFNKYVASSDIFIISDASTLDLLCEYFVWLGNCKQELIHLYDQHTSTYKTAKADQNWFDGLVIWDVEIEVKQGIIYGNFAITDYYNNNMGFHLETVGKTISSMEYDPIL